MKSRISLIVFLFLLSQLLFSQREMWMSTTDENILKRATVQSKVLFQLPLGHQLLENMQLVDENKLLLGLIENTPQLRSSSYMMIDSNTGKINWQYTCEKGSYSTFWVSNSSIVLKREEKKKTSFVCLDLDTGKLLWKRDYPNNYGFVLETNTEIFINYSAQKDVVVLAAVSLKNGESLWETEVTTSWNKQPFVLLDGGKAFVFSDTITVVDIDTGKVETDFGAKKIGEVSPLIPSLDETHLFLVNSENHLSCFSKTSGELLWEMELPKTMTPTNLTSQTNHLYVRGEDKTSNFHLISVSKKDGKIKWSQKQKEALTSNLIENDDLLYFASSATLFAVNAETGQPIFNKSITRTGRSFPVSLRINKDRVAFIGELILAGYDKNTGKLIYKHGFSPIDINLHYNGLDSSLPKLEKDLERMQNYENSGAAQMASNQRAYYQKMSDKNYSDFLKYRSQRRPGIEYKANMARYRSRMYSSMARMQAGLSLSFAILELGSALEQLMQANATQAEIRKQEYYRKSILDVYTSALSENYVFRPNLKYYKTDDQYVSVSVVDLYSGKKKDFLLSPQYLEYGLWNLIDYKRGVIYHHGVGMNPEKYNLSKSRRVPLVKFKTVETFLVAQPFSID